MQIQRIAISVVFATAIAALPLSAARAQYYPACSPFPLFWPFCIAGAIVGTAATVVTTPLRAVAAPPIYPEGVPYQAPPAYPPQPYPYPYPYPYPRR